MGALGGAVRRRIESWRYAEDGKRDRRLDFLRGYCVFAMAVDHLGANSWLALLTGGNRFLVSAAEGFLFLSGLVMGIVYQPLVARVGLGAATVKALRRACLIYALTVGATLGFMGLSTALGLPWAEDVHPVSAAPAVLRLRETFYLTEVLMLYTVLIALAPIAFALLRGRLTWLLLALSWGIWGIHQIRPINLPWPSEADAFFYVAAWQVLFFTGLTIGWHRQGLSSYGRDVGTPRVLIVSALGLGGLVVLWAWISGLLGHIDAPTMERMWTDFAKWNLPPARLVACGVVFAFAFSLVDLFWNLLTRVAGRFLLPLGQAALAAYVVHLIAVALLTAAGERIEDGAALTRTQTTVLQVVALALVWLGVRVWRDARSGNGLPALHLPGATYARVGIGAVAAFLVLVAPTSTTSAARLAATPVPPVTLPADDHPAEPPAPTLADYAHSGVYVVPPLPVASPPLLTGDRADDIATAYPSQSRVEERAFFSDTLGREMPYIVYVPPGYDTSEQRYPVLYMLHGMGGSNTEWKGYGLFGAADELMRTYQIPPMLIVLPQGDQSYWFDHADGAKWGTYTAVDVVREMDEQFRTVPDRAHRAIGGLSMGAAGALQLGINYPDVFRVVGAHSPTIRNWSESLEWFPPDFYGSDPTVFARSDPFTLYQMHPDVARTLDIWLDVGTDDVSWRPVTTDFHNLLDELAIPHEFHVLPGDHNGDRYWGPHSAEYVQFYAKAFASADLPAA